MPESQSVKMTMAHPHASNYRISLISQPKVWQTKPLKCLRRHDRNIKPYSKLSKSTHSPWISTSLMLYRNTSLLKRPPQIKRQRHSISLLLVRMEKARKWFTKKDSDQTDTNTQSKPRLRKPLMVWDKKSKETQEWYQTEIRRKLCFLQHKIHMQLRQ